MKYVITGGAGNVSKPLTEKLLSAGQQVTTIGRSAKHLEELVAKGAIPAVGSIEDVDFLTKTFAGADAVFTMVPPNFSAVDWKGWIEQIGKNYAKAIKANNIKYVVNMSSIGGHLAEGAGPISGLHRVEEALNKLADVHIKHLRPVYFYPNLLSNVALAKNLGVVGSNFGEPDFKLVMTSPADIADVAAEELLIHNFTDHSFRYISSDERTGDEIAKVFGDAIGKPLKWVVFSDTDALNGMIQAGLPLEIAKNYVEMGSGLRRGIVTEDYWKRRPASLQKTKLEDFAKTFAAIYNSTEKESIPVHG